MFFIQASFITYTFAVVGATPRPVLGFTANADATHSVMVSGAVADSVAVPPLKQINV